MKRTFGVLAIAVTVLLLAMPLLAEAQQGRKWRIGFLGGGSPRSFASFLDVLKEDLRERGYVEGQNITFEYRYADGVYERLPTLARELVRVNADLIVTEGTPPIHILFSDVINKNARRVDGLLVLDDPMFRDHETEIAELAKKSKLPSIFGIGAQATVGGLMNFGPNRHEMYRRAAFYIDKIFKGAKPADLPVEQPTKFDLIINLKTAKALGLTIPQSLLGRADQVIE
jgi:ABC-type uncharacterized transport system substrate-binding protein